MRSMTVRIEDRLESAVVRARRSDTPFPTDLLVHRILQQGKDGLAPSLLSDLSHLRAARSDDPLLTALLDCVLDKYERRYNYRSYLALGVLQPLLPGSGGPLPAGQLIRLLMADVTAFEMQAADDPGDSRLPAGRPNPDVARRRIRKALRLSTGTDDPKRMPTPPDEQVKTVLACSVLPVSAHHDEYLFIRVLQAYETAFLLMGEELHQALRAAHRDDTAGLAVHIDAATDALDGAAGLFSLLATMPPESFHGFRGQTDGSSAIQSRAYKTVELLCGLPTRQRRDSAAFRSVPEIREQALSEPESLATWYISAAPQLPQAERETVQVALARLERSHQKWKRTHHALARAMIGQEAGTGDTVGGAYLRRCLDNRLFWEVGARCPGREVHRSKERHRPDGGSRY
ncbi:hypothetical protein [Streptomyces noursei]|uniref:hypothetical protein n=1 Tax=Streptomyces noursei TaxID=1971 RepID=UPI0011AF53E1|nr:hypothetical protein [Streptomyces noursei]